MGSSLLGLCPVRQTDTRGGEMRQRIRLRRQNAGKRGRWNSALAVGALIIGITPGIGLTVADSAAADTGPAGSGVTSAAAGADRIAAPQPDDPKPAPGVPLAP